MLKKYKKVFVAFGLILVLSAIGFFFLNKRRSSGSPLGSSEEIKESEKLVFEFELADWEDPAGFSFSYPKELKIDPHEEDEVNYANLEITNEKQSGKILIIVNDATHTTIEDWLEKDELAQGGNALDATVAEVKGKKVAFSDGKIITAFIDPDQVIYLLQKEAADDKDYWSQAYQVVLDSFELIPLEGESEASFQNWLQDFDTSQADVVEPVEVIQ